jgi:hypothetical protein
MIPYMSTVYLDQVHHFHYIFIFFLSLPALGNKVNPDKSEGQGKALMVLAGGKTWIQTLLYFLTFNFEITIESQNVAMVVHRTLD